MPWSVDGSPKEERLVRRMAYYVFWRSEQIGKAKAAEVMGIHRETLRRYSRYTYTENDPKPSHSLDALQKLAAYCDDEFELVVFSILNSTDFYMFRDMLERCRLVVDIDNQSFAQQLTDANIPRQA